MDNTLDDSEFYEDFWRDAGYQYAYAMDSAVRDRFPAIEKVWGGLRRPHRVLDFGCGNGVLSYWMYQNSFAYKVLGVDVSKTGVRNAHREFAQPGLDYRVITSPMNVRQLGEFDAVVSSHVLEHIPDVDEALASLKGVAKWYVFEVPLEDCLFQTLKWSLLNKPRRENSLGHVQFWTRESFRNLLASHGYVVIRDYIYASAPFSPYNNKWVRMAEKLLLRSAGLNIYSKIMATHYIVLASENPWQ
ncbi:class I SAM-dependent methyltransferase [Hahella aquimaris]|uniref:class I SAM-dependent methyltransferase n=1 Tax=Hahella sp. HNIBRBA332 TaxID=3015983 RepID=UPI00273CBEF1|nr:class I SAM-dependent methyltransferase [Hahella sp. HNIBRBA332]WLQ15460.1 class I SAM-dependent methyltransferase [Hahella sp. HNIBRBA332]